MIRSFVVGPKSNQPTPGTTVAASMNSSIFFNELSSNKEISNAINEEGTIIKPLVRILK